MVNPYYLAAVIGESLIGITTIIGNGIVLCLIAREKDLQTPTNYFVASLASADLLVGAVGIPCVIVATHGMPSNFYGCLLVNSMIVILTQISIFGLLAIAIERFFAIRNPFKYQVSCTKKVCLLTIVLSWMAAILAGLIPLFGWNLGPMETTTCAFEDVIDLRYMVYFNFFVCVLVPLGVTFVVYVYIYRVVIHHQRAIAALQSTGNNASTNSLTHKNLRRDIKAAKWFAVVIFFFAVSWLPIHIINCITVFQRKTCFACLIAAILLSHLNSAINPFFYALGNSKFRRAWRRLIGTPEAAEDSITSVAESHARQANTNQ